MSSWHVSPAKIPFFNSTLDWTSHSFFIIRKKKQTKSFIHYILYTISDKAKQFKIMIICTYILFIKLTERKKETKIVITNRFFAAIVQKIEIVWLLKFPSIHTNSQFKFDWKEKIIKSNFFEVWNSNKRDRFLQQFFFFITNM